MKVTTKTYHGYRFPIEMIGYSVWLYHRFTLSFRDVEELLAERGVVVSYETVRQWCRKFGPESARRLRQREGRMGDIWHLDEVFVNIRGTRHYLWRAVDQDGDVIDILVQPRRDERAAVRLFRKLLKGQQAKPWRLVTDKLKSYVAAHRAVIPSAVHDTARYQNNPAEVSHQRTRHKSARCRVSNPRLKRGTPLFNRLRASCPFMDRSRISFGLGASACAQRTADYGEGVRSNSGGRS